MDENNKALYRCCFTGHRPEKLNMAETEIRKRLEKMIRQAVDDGYTSFISGMARGVDIWAAQIVLQLRQTNNNIKLICALPFIGFEKSRSLPERQLYENILESADYVKLVCNRYFPGCFQIRNQYMVNNSSRVIAAYNGSAGGTRNTIRYAERKNIEIVNLFENE